MNKIKIFSFISLDGYISRMDGDMEWLLEYPSPKEKNNYDFDLFYHSVSSAIMNDRHYANWQMQDISPFGDKEIRIICSQAVPANIGNNITPIFNYGGNDKSYLEKIKELKETANGDIWLAGDHKFIVDCIERGLVDEITLNILPVTLGSGNHLFKRNGSDHDWVFEKSKIYDNDVVQLQYRVLREGER